MGDSDEAEKEKVDAYFNAMQTAAEQMNRDHQTDSMARGSGGAERIPRSGYLPTSLRELRLRFPWLGPRRAHYKTR